MKKTIVIAIAVIAFSCKKEETKKAVESTTETVEVTKEKTVIKTLEGEFLYYADAAVLKTRQEVYGVVIDTKMHELATLVAPLKKADTDMVKVIVKGKITPKEANEEGWPLTVVIKEIIKVKQLATNDNIVIKNK